MSDRYMTGGESHDTATRARDLVRLASRLSSEVSNSTSFEGSVHETLRAICEASGWEVGQVWTRCIGESSLLCHPAWYASDESFAAFREATRSIAPLGAGFPPSLAAAQTVHLIVDVASEPAFLRREAALRAGLVTGIFIPVVLGGDVVAVFEFFSRRRVAPDDLAVSAAVAALPGLGNTLERRRLDESSLVLRELSQQSAEALAISRADEERTLSFVNGALCNLLGREESELLGRTVCEVFGPMVSVHGEMTASLRAAQPYRGEVTVTRGDGRMAVCECSVTPVAASGERITHHVVVLRDVTEERRREAERVQLRRSIMLSARQWRQTFDAIESPVVIVDALGTIHRLNRRATEMSGRSYSLNIGNPLSTLGAREPWHTAELLLHHVVDTAEGAQDQVVDPHSGRSWDVSVTPLGNFVDVGGMGRARFLVLAQDVSRLVELRHSLRRQETMAAMGELVAGVAHEVRNPLFGLSATLDAFESRFGTHPDHAPYLRVLRTSVERMATLMRDLLDYGRPPTPQLDQGDFEATLLASVAACSALASTKRVTVDVNVGPIPRTMMLDTSRIERVLTNLVENAIQHAPEGSTVAATARPSECGQWLQCRLHDEGPGFEPEDLPHLFSPFFTRRPGGTGLGLAIVQRIVEQHGGHVAATNDPRGGAVVTVQLPLLGETS